MVAVTIRNLSDAVHHARAAHHNRSTEAAMRALLKAAVRPADRLRLGTALADISRKIWITTLMSLPSIKVATPGPPPSDLRAAATAESPATAASAGSATRQARR